MRQVDSRDILTLHACRDGRRRELATLVDIASTVLDITCPVAAATGWRRGQRGGPVVEHIGYDAPHTIAHDLTAAIGTHRHPLLFANFGCPDRLREGRRGEVDLIRLHGQVAVRRQLFGGTPPHTRAGCDSPR